jgi:TonB family protein
MKTAQAARLVRPFTPPPERPRLTAGPSLPDAPSAQMSSAPITAPVLTAAIGGAPSRVPPKPFSAPAGRVQASAAPALDDAPPTGGPAGAAEATLAIASLNPTTAPKFEPPTASRDAGFSAGPRIKPEGGEGAPGDHIIVVPGLLARGDTPDNQPALLSRATLPMRPNLLAGVRPAAGAMPGAPPPPAPPIATRVSGAPDPRLEGRAVFSMAIQMPNVTSYSGSWMVWFAERGSEAGQAGLQAPAPMRKVDPRYTPAAISERVEGTVRLFAVIRKDGHVDSVALVQRLDDRLDQSSIEALSKWQFTPALRGGVPVEVDAVFEIPFRLAPRTKSR